MKKIIIQFKKNFDKLMIISFTVYIAIILNNLDFSYMSIFDVAYSIFITIVIMGLLGLSIISIKKQKIFKPVFLFSTLVIFLTLNIYSYINYKTIDLNTIYKLSNIFNSENYQEKIYNKDYIDANLKYNVIERVGGTNKNVFNNLLIKETPQHIISITFKISNTDKKIKYFTLVFENNLNKKTYNRHYIPDKDSNDYSILITSMSNYDHFEFVTAIGSSITDLDSNTLIIDFDQIIINDSRALSRYQSNMLSQMLLIFMLLSFLMFIVLIGYKYKWINIIYKIKFNTIKVFIVLTLLIGIIFSFLIPVFQTPDENAHLSMIGEYIGDLPPLKDLVFEKLDDPGRIMGNYSEKVNKEEYLNFNLKLTDNSFSIKSVGIKMIRHFPQIIGISIGMIINLPLFFIFALGELFAIIFYVLICAIALKVIPFKKTIMMFIMLLPIAIQQMSSFSYDVVLNSCSFLFIAYILHLKFTKKIINFKDLLLLAFLLLAITVCKIPYVIIGLLVFLLPLYKINLKIFKINIDKAWFIKYRKIIITSMVFSVIPAILIIKKISMVRILAICFLEPIAILKLLWGTIKSKTWFYLGSIAGNFGQLDTPVDNIFIWLVIFFAIIFSFINFKKSGDKLITEDQPFSKLEIIWFYIIFLGSFLLIHLALLTWTLYIENLGGASFDYSLEQLREYIYLIPNCIQGVQGRYFIPLLPLIFIPIYNNKVSHIIKRIDPLFIQIIYYLIIFGYIISVVLNRYWI